MAAIEESARADVEAEQARLESRCTHVFSVCVQIANELKLPVILFVGAECIFERACSEHCRLHSHFAKKKKLHAVHCDLSHPSATA